MAANRNKKGTWTIKEAEALMTEVLEWMKKSPDNMFPMKYLLEVKLQTKSTIDYILDIYRDEKSVVGTWKTIQEIQKERIMAGALTGKFKENFAKFLLNCNHNMIPKSEQQIDLKGDFIKFEFGTGSPQSSDEDK